MYDNDEEEDEGNELGYAGGHEAFYNIVPENFDISFTDYSSEDDGDDGGVTFYGSFPAPSEDVPFFGDDNEFVELYHDRVSVSDIDEYIQMINQIAGFPGDDDNMRQVPALANDNVDTDQNVFPALMNDENTDEDQDVLAERNADVNNINRNYEQSTVDIISYQEFAEFCRSFDIVPTIEDYERVKLFLMELSANTGGPGDNYHAIA